MGRSKLRDENLRAVCAVFFYFSQRKGLTIGSLSDEIGLHRNSVHDVIAGFSVPRKGTFTQHWLKAMPELKDQVDYGQTRSIPQLTDEGRKTLDLIAKSGKDLFYKGPNQALLPLKNRTPEKPVPQPKPTRMRQATKEEVLAHRAPMFELGLNLGHLSASCSNVMHWKTALEKAHQAGMTLGDVVSAITTVSDRPRSAPVVQAN